jgi:hypothetical protein
VLGHFHFCFSPDKLSEGIEAKTFNDPHGGAPVGWLERRRERRESDREFNEVVMQVHRAMAKNMNESKETGLPTRPLTRSEMFGGETTLWRALVQLAPDSDYVGFNFFYEDGHLGLSEIESPKPGHLVGHGVTEWPDSDTADEFIKLAVFSHAAHELRGALGLEQEGELVGDLEELEIEIIWDPPLPT